MFKQYLSAVLTLTCLLGSSMTAYAKDPRSIVVNVPFEFIAGTTVLPAGTYSVERTSSDSDSALVIHGYGNSVFLLPVVFDGITSGQVSASFEQKGNKHFLSRIATPTGAYTIAITRPATTLVMVKSDDTVSPAGAN
jgi:hypothetical protein